MIMMSIDVLVCSAYHGHTIAVMDLSPYKKTGHRPDWVHVVSETVPVSPAVHHSYCLSH